MRYRLFLAFLAACFAVQAFAQAPARPLKRVGIFTTSPYTAGQIADSIRFFEAGMRELGWVEGKNIEYDREPPPISLTDPAIMRQHAEKLISRRPDAIWLINTANARIVAEALQQSGTQIPIVGAAVNAAVIEKGAGNSVPLAESLARPGKNFTGLVNVASELGGKRLALVRELIPKLTRVGVLVYARSQDGVPVSASSQDGAPDSTPFDTSRQELDLIKQAAAARHITVEPAYVSRDEDLGPAFSRLAKANVQAVLVTHVPYFGNRVDTLVALAADKRLPLVGYRDVFADKGAIMSYGSSLREQMVESARLVDKILKGAKPGDIPIERPAKYELVINRATAKRLGVTVPQSLKALETRPSQ